MTEHAVNSCLVHTVASTLSRQWLKCTASNDRRRKWLFWSLEWL